MTVSLICVVRGSVYERYAGDLLASAKAFFRPAADVEIRKLPGRAGDWPYCSASRYSVILEYADEIKGDFIFQTDADAMFLRKCGPEILSDGLTVTTHPGFPLESDRATWPYDRNPNCKAYVAPHEGTQYYPGAFVGGERGAFLDFCDWIDHVLHEDLAKGISPEWYDESYLNRYLIDHPPALVLDKRYCWWEFWGYGPEAILMHRDKTAEDLAERAAWSIA